VGTPFYLAPELWQDKPCSKKSDVWAIGVILYEMVCMKYPFEAHEMEVLEQKVRNAKFAQIHHSVNKSFVSIIQKCLAKRPENRPTVEELIMSNEFQ
jgi:serine/threonine protein kinase